MNQPTFVTGGPLAHLRWPALGRADAPTVLLLHGIGGGRNGWPGVAPALAAAGCEVLAVDFPGYGASPPVAPYDLRSMAAAVSALVAQTGRGPAVLVGHSMGGMVAQEVVAESASQVRALVRALVLTSTSPSFGKPDGDWQQGFLNSRFAPLDAGLGMDGLAAQLVPAMVGPEVPADRVAAAQAVMAGVPEATYRAAVKALLPFDRRAALPAIAVPTLVVTGEHDRTAPPELSRRMAERIPGAQLAIVPGAGHLLPMEWPERFVGVLRPFLDSLR